MKQLFAAGAIPTNENPNGFPTLTATSAGISPDAVSMALGLVNYAPPMGSTESRLPVRLALLNTAHAGRVLTHIAPSAGRYFAHALLNVPPTADAQLAIQTWGSNQWQRNAPDSHGDLPELPYLPVTDILDDTALKNWLVTPAHRDMLEFTLHALLGTPSSTRIVLATTAEDVAKVVYGVTRILPTNLLDEFTFSTYETYPVACNARLVGHETGSPEQDLSPECYEGDHVALNPQNGRRSLLPGEVPFAAYAVNTFTQGQWDKLDAIKESWQKLGLKEARHFDLVFRLTRGTGVLSKEEAVEALALPAVASWISARTDAQKQFLDWAIEDRTFATESFSRVVQSLRQKTDAINRLTVSVRDRGNEALAAGDLEKTTNAFEVILPMIAPAKANAIWGELLAQTPDPNTLSWAARWYLLPRFVRFKQSTGTGIDPVWNKWLDVPTGKLADALQLDLPRPYLMMAIRACLNREGEPTPELARVLATQPKLALVALQPEGGVTADRAVKLYEKLLSESASHPWLEELLAAANQYPRELLNRFFEATQEAGKVDADRVIRAQGTMLLELLTGQSGLDRIGKQLLANPPFDLLQAHPVLDFLRKLQKETQLSPELQTRIAAVLSVRTYLDAPNFEAAAMTATSDALTTTPAVVPSSAKATVFASVVQEFLRRAESGNLQQDLEAALVHFANSLASGSTDLFENLLRELRSKIDFGRQSNLVHTFLALALGATRSSELANKLDGLDGHAFAIASDAAKRGGNRLLDTLDAKSRDWPKEAKTKWGFLMAAVRPQSRMVRDAACVGIGAVAASVLWLIVKMIA